jgi:hypothetical protein
MAQLLRHFNCAQKYRQEQHNKLLGELGVGTSPEVEFCISSLCSLISTISVYEI